MPILKEGELDIFSHSAEQTGRLGMRLGQLLQPGDVVCLSGDMGAGKTVFTTGIGRGWGATSKITSPTFNLVHPHRRPADAAVLYHLDCYRLHDASEVETIGFDDMIDTGGILIIEWAENIMQALPDERLWIELRVLEELRRNFVIEATGKRYEKLLIDFRQAAFGF